MRIYAATDIGRKRPVNEDCLAAVETPVGPLDNLMIIADGMGGHKAGDFASRYLVDHLTEAVSASADASPIRVMREALEKANGDAAKVQADFDAYKQQVETEKTNAGKKALIKKAREAANANPAAIDLMLGTVDLDKVELDGEALKDAEAVLKPIKEAHAALFGTVQNQGTPPLTPPSGAQKDPKEMNFTEYKEWRKANP